MMQKFRTRWLSVGTAPIVGADADRPCQDAAVAVVLGFGVVLIVTGQVLYLKRSELVARVTSRSLGSLAPGYAATPKGVTVYTYLVTSVGMVLAGIGLAQWFTVFGGLFAICGMLAFVVFSIIAIVGEVRVYRALKR
jgi:Ni,Fe-hydrogenase I cytochrome b subunit